MDTSGGVGVWFGGEGKVEKWSALVMVAVADQAKLLETVKRLAKREGAMDAGEKVAHEGGEWYTSSAPRAAHHRTANSLSVAVGGADHRQQGREERLGKDSRA